MPPRLHKLINPLAAGRQVGAGRSLSSIAVASPRLTSRNAAASVTLSRLARPVSLAPTRCLQPRLQSTVAAGSEVEGATSTTEGAETEGASTPNEEATQEGATEAEPVKKPRKSRKKAEGDVAAAGDEASTPKKRTITKKKKAEEGGEEGDVAPKKIRKEKEDAAGEGEDVAPKKGGRPRAKKSDDPAEPGQGEDVAPKKRGRPRTKKSDDPAEPVEDAAPKKTRKKKEDAAGEGEDVAPEKRGRPRTKKSDEPAEPVAAKTMADLPYRRTTRKNSSKTAVQEEDDPSGVLPYVLEVPREKLDAELASENPYVWPHLPAPEKWRMTSLRDYKHGFLGRSRYFVCNRFTVRSIVDSMGLPSIVKANGGKKVTIVETFAGPGTLTRELVMREQVGKIVAFEEQKAYVPWLQRLKEDPTAVDAQGVHASEKIHWIDHSGYFWRNYDVVQEAGLLDHLQSYQDQTIEEAVQLAPLVFVSQYPNSVHGDQLFVQLMTAMSSGQWLFQYGRVKMINVIPEVLAAKAAAAAGSFERAKLGATASLLATQETLLPNDPDLSPAAAHLYPPIVGAGKRSFHIRHISNDNFASPERNKPLIVYSMAPRARQVLAWRKARGIVDPEDHPVLQELRETATAAKAQEDEVAAAAAAAAAAEATTEDGKKKSHLISGPKTVLTKGSKVENSTVFPTQGVTGVVFESLDYLMRNLFATRRTSVADALSRTYPGAGGILQRLEPEGGWDSVTAVRAGEGEGAEGKPAQVLLTPKGDVAVRPNKPVKDLTEDEWISIARTFEKWPFRPEHLFEEGRASDRAQATPDFTEKYEVGSRGLGG